MDNCYIITESTNGSGFVGGVTGRVLGALTVTNCSVSGKIEMTRNGNSGGLYVGGIVGAVAATGTVSISDCVNSATVNSTESVGGVVAAVTAAASVTIENCVNEGDVSVDGSKNTSQKAVAGGIVGSNVGTTTIRSCVNEGVLIGENCEAVGGIAGNCTTKPITIQNCVNKGDMTVEQTRRLAGIVARAVGGGSVEGCVNFGDMTSKNHEIDTWGVHRIGGIMGDAHSPKVPMKTCANFGDIVSTENITGKTELIGIGGLSGTLSYNCDIINCLSAGDIIATGNVSGVVGRIVNSSAATYQNIIVTGTVSALNETVDVNTFWGGANFAGTVKNNYFAGVQQYKASAEATEWTAFTAVKDGFTVVSADSLKGASGMKLLSAAGFDFDSVWHLSAGCPVPTELAVQKGTLDTDTDVVYKGYQEKLVAATGTEEADTFAVRLVSGVNSLNYLNIGFELYVLNADGMNVMKEKMTTDTVYTALNAYSEDGSISDPVTAEGLDCSYLCAITVGDLPSEGDCILYAVPYVTDAELTVNYGTMIALVIEDGTIVDQYAI